MYVYHILLFSLLCTTTFFKPNVKGVEQRLRGRENSRTQERERETLRRARERESGTRLTVGEERERIRAHGSGKEREREKMILSLFFLPRSWQSLARPPTDEREKHLGTKNKGDFFSESEDGFPKSAHWTLNKWWCKYRRHLMTEIQQLLYVKKVRIEFQILLGFLKNS